MKLLFRKFRLWLMNQHISYVMDDMFYWMVRRSRYKLDLEIPGYKGEYDKASIRYEDLAEKFERLIAKRNAYQDKHNLPNPLLK